MPTTTRFITTPKDAVDPRHQEELFEPRHFLEAVEKIGGDGSQAFYRTLAAESDDELRMEAAIQLDEAGPQDRKLNLLMKKGSGVPMSKLAGHATSHCVTALPANFEYRSVLSQSPQREYGFRGGRSESFKLMKSDNRKITVKNASNSSIIVTNLAGIVCGVASP